jgi:predicted alternative tryptophan synthase beta-subunit
VNFNLLVDELSFSSSLTYIFRAFVGGLRYHGMAPLISHVYNLGLMEAIAIPQIECFQGKCPFHGCSEVFANTFVFGFF